MTKERRAKIIGAVLKTVAVGGVVTMAVMAPNTLQLLRFVPAFSRQRYYRQRYVNSVINRLIRRELLSRSLNESGQVCLSLTKSGERELEKYELEEISIPRPKRWDGQYRVIIFDIKEYRRKVRDEIRLWLIHLGFVRLQDSVWVYPYECQEIITLLKTKFQVGKDLLYLTVKSIENDMWLKRHFDLI
ncbi:MAG: hypothetical protein HYT48_01350 [Candidatus Vogelbacteria bacterium]|nr:hypothetical protein [Candidatus Vogelbacteria bacterium]